MAEPSSGELWSRGVAAALAEIAAAVARAQQGERVTIQSLGIAVVPSRDLDALGLSDDETEEGMIELDR